MKITFQCRLCPAWFEDFERLVMHWETVHTPTLEERWEVASETPALLEYVPAALYRQMASR